MKVNQKGFSVVEIVVVVVIIGLLGAVGWLVYDRSKNNTNDNQTSAQATEQNPEETNTTSTDNDTHNYMTIKEWGVKLPVDSNVGGLSYTITGKYTSIRSDELDKLSGSCDSNSVNVARGTANEVVPNEIGSDEGTTFLEKYNSTTTGNNLNSRSIKAKAGNYYFVAPDFAGASCVNVSSETSEGKAKLASEEAAMVNIVKAINKLVQQ